MQGVLALLLLAQAPLELLVLAQACARHLCWPNGPCMQECAGSAAAAAADAFVGDEGSC